MVQGLLARSDAGNWVGLCLCMVLAVGVAVPAYAEDAKAEKNEPTPGPELLLQGGRKLAFVRTFTTDRDVSPKRSFFKKVIDVVAGAPDRHQTIRPYGIAVDSRGRAIVTDPGAMGIHIFDFREHKYKFIASTTARSCPCKTISVGKLNSPFPVPVLPIVCNTLPPISRT